MVGPGAGGLGNYMFCPLLVHPMAETLPCLVATRSDVRTEEDKMTAMQTELVDELKVLRKGRGLFVRHIGERVGSALRAVCEVTDADSPVEIRQKVGQRLGILARSLPPDLQIAVVAAFAISPDVRLPLYQDRVSWAAAKLNRDPRTARRRIDDGIHHLAQLAAHAVPERSIEWSMDRWHTHELRATLALDRDRPEVLEQHRVVAVEDGLTEVDLVLTVPTVFGSDTSNMTVEMFHGGTLIARRPTAGDGYTVSVQLPGPLARGESHDFVLRTYLSGGDVVRAHFACAPARRCALVDLRVRFDRRRVPAHIRVLENVQVSDFANSAHDGVEVAVDAAGEVRGMFSGPVCGMAYGLRWTS
jgi:hypothetical protein